MKIIFLDIDGVLNNLYTKETFQGFVFLEDEKILLLKEIIEKTKAEIVLSSTWRKGWILKSENPYSSNEDVCLFEALEEKLAEYDIELMGCTEEIGTRGEEITEWLENHKEDVESYVILDDADESEFTGHENHLVTTSIEDGLTMKAVVEAVSILNERKDEYSADYYNELNDTFGEMVCNWGGDEKMIIL